VEEATYIAFEQVGQAARAVGLNPVQIDAVCAAVQAATSEPEAAVRFVRVQYAVLRRACANGEAELVRGWMDGMMLFYAAGGSF